MLDLSEKNYVSNFPKWHYCEKVWESLYYIVYEHMVTVTRILVAMVTVTCILVAMVTVTGILVAMVTVMGQIYFAGGLHTLPDKSLIDVQKYITAFNDHSLYG